MSPTRFTKIYFLINLMILILLVLFNITVVKIQIVWVPEKWELHPFVDRGSINYMICLIFFFRRTICSSSDDVFSILYLMWILWAGFTWVNGCSLPDDYCECYNWTDFPVCASTVSNKLVLTTLVNNQLCLERNAHVFCGNYMYCNCNVHSFIVSEIVFSCGKLISLC
jgi:hypothetical protein